MSWTWLQQLANVFLKIVGQSKSSGDSPRVSGGNSVHVGPKTTSQSITGSPNARQINIEQLTAVVNESPETGESLVQIKSVLNSMYKDSEYKSKYSLGHCVVYADGSEHIFRAGKALDVYVDWTRSGVQLTSDFVIVRVTFSGQRGISRVSGTFAKSFDRHKPGVELIATILDGTDLKFELVEDIGTGIVGVFGLSPNPEAGKEGVAKIGIRI